MGKRCEEVEMGKRGGVLHDFWSSFSQKAKGNSQVIYEFYQLARQQILGEKEKLVKSQRKIVKLLKERREQKEPFRLGETEKALRFAGGNVIWRQRSL